MLKSLKMIKRSQIIANLLIVSIALVLASEIYALILHILKIEHTVGLIPFRIVAICIILILAMLLRSSEIEPYKRRIESIAEKLAGEERLLREYKEAIDKSAVVSKADKNGTILYVNKRFCKLTGYQESELIGQTYGLIRHPQNDRGFYRDLWLTILSKRAWSGRIKNIKKDGTTFFVEATIVPLLDTNNEIIEFMSIMFDITKEVLHEQERMQHQEDELSKTKESFLLIFTHELKTPLNAIINFSSFVKKRIEKEKIEDKDRLCELLDSVKQNGEDMLFSITNMLDTAKLMNKKMAFASSVFDLGELLKEVAQKTLPPSGFKVTMDVEEGILLKSDRLRVGQVISNIISNTIKYGDGEMLAILRSNGEDEFELRIEDNGAGLKNTNGLFDLFWSDTQETTRASKGTGIGLHYAKMLCDEFGLELALCKSDNLSGACFCIKGKRSLIAKSIDS